MNITITRDGATTSALTVHLTYRGTATSGTDYATMPASITIAAGQATGTLMLTPIDDALVEGLETASVNIAASAAYTRGTPSGVGININDNDNASPITTIGIVFATHGTSSNTPTQSILTNGVQVQWMQATDPQGTNGVPRQFLRIKILPVP